MSFDFKAWSDTSKLTSTTIKALEDADLADEDLALSCVTPAILQQLKLTVGQYALLCKATAKLQAGTVPVPAAAKAKVTLDDLKQDCRDCHPRTNRRHGRPASRSDPGDPGPGQRRQPLCKAR
ncbi:hypothetical protein Bbelb_361610 [Branchiostoma belcheri]|nr:hypothetical protein Bbelb_361610 [Branchiostoma belcheri]